MPCPDSERLSEKFITKIFQGIDINSRGCIGKEDLHLTLLQLGVPASSDHINHVFQKMKKDNDDYVSLSEFLVFVRGREDELYEIFKTVRPDKHGKIKITWKNNQVKLARALMDKLEMAKDLQEALNISAGIASESGEHDVSFHDFTHLLLFMTKADIRIVFDYWTRSSRIDLGEDYLVPSEPTLEKSRFNIFLSGALAGCLSRTFTAPLDRLKVIMQAGKGDNRIIHGLEYIYREGGFLGLWRGNLVNCIKIAPESASKFFFYGEFKPVVTFVTGGDPHHLTSLEKFIAGAGAGLVSQTIIYPLEIVKTRLALSVTGEYHGIVDVFRDILSTGGVRGLFRGLSPSLLGIVPYAGIDLMVFNTLKENWIARYQRSSSYQYRRKGQQLEPAATPGVLTLLSFGAISSTCGQVVAYPFQLIRTRLQADKAGVQRKYKGMVDCFYQITREYGLIGLYRGIGPNFLKSVPSISISYAVFETVSTDIARRGW